MHNAVDFAITIGHDVLKMHMINALSVVIQMTSSS